MSDVIGDLAAKLVELPDGEFRLVADDECRRRISREGSARIVDAIVGRRGNATPDPRIALIASAMMHPTAVQRYYMELTAMKKSIEIQIAARKAEIAAKRIDPDIDQIEARYLNWRAGVLRLLSAIEERISGSRIVMGKFGVAEQARALREARDDVGERVNALIDAIRQHREVHQSRGNYTDADTELWSWLGED